MNVFIIIDDMTRYRGSIHISDVHDGRDAVTLVVTPSVISVDTKSDGTVDESCLTNARAVIKAYAGGKPLKLGIQSVEKSTGIDAVVTRADNFGMAANVKVTNISTTPIGYAMASGNVTVTLLVKDAGVNQTVTAVIGIVTTLHKVTSEIAKDNTSIRQSVTDLTAGIGDFMTKATSEINTLNGAILNKVSRVDYDTDKQEQNKRETEFRQSVDNIAFTLTNRSNLLRGTGFRNEKTLPMLTGNAEWSTLEADLYGSHGVIHAPMSTEPTARNAGIRYLVPRKDLQNGREYTFSVGVLIKDTASLSNISTEQYYVKVDKQTRIGGMLKYTTWGSSAFSEGSWRRVSVTFTPNFTKVADSEFLELRYALFGKGEAWFAEPQLELGAIATPWTPNVNDADDNLQATALELANRKIIATADNFVVRNNEGIETAAVDKDGNLTAGSLVTAGNGMYSSIRGGMWETGLRTSNGGHSTDSPAFRMAVDSEGFAVLQYIRNGRVVGVIDEAFFGGKSVGDTFVPTTMKPLGTSLPQQIDGGIFQTADVTFYRFQCGYTGGSPAIYNYTRTAVPPSFDNKMFKAGRDTEEYLTNVANFAPDGYYTSDKFFHIWRDGDGEDIGIWVIKIESGVTTVTNEVYGRVGDVYVHKQTVIQE